MSAPDWGYLRVAVETPIRWPAEDTEIEFGGRTVTLSPETDENFASILIECNARFPKDAALRLAYEFATAVAWAERRELNLPYMVACTSPGLHLGKPRSKGHVGTGEFEYLAHPADQKTKLALALFREGLTINVVPYQFLAFYKVINLHAGSSGPAQIAWINLELPHLTRRDAAKRIADLTASGTADIGEYLYGQGRCAAAHASLTSTTINPDDPADSVRLDQDLPIVESLAARIIEHHLGLKSFDAWLRERCVKPRASV